MSVLSPCGEAACRRVGMVAVAVAMLVACGGGHKTVRKPGDEYLAKIRIEKTTKVSSDADIIAGLSINRAVGKRALDEYQLGLDVQRVEGLMAKHGFLNAKVTPRVERNGDAQIAVFHIDEGPRATATVVIEGLPPEVDPAQARKLVALKNGDPFEYDAFDEAKTPMLALVENAGYAHAVMEAAVIADKAANRAVLHYAFDPGPRSTFGAVEVVGVTGALADAARARLTFKPGDGYSTKALAQSEEAIYGIGMFASVRVFADRAGVNTVVPVRIQLIEALHWEAKFGVGLGFDTLTYNSRFRGSLSHTGWPTPLSTLSLEARPALTILRDNCSPLDLVEFQCRDVEPRVRVLGSATQQDFLYPGIKAELQGGYDYVTLEGFLEQGPLARVGVTSPLGTSRLVGHVGWQFASYDFSKLHPALDPNVDPAATDIPADPSLAAELGLVNPDGTPGHERLGAFTQSLELDLRDNPVEPTQGAYAQIKVAEGTAAAGGAFDYLQLTPELRGYASVGDTVFAAHARFGAILGDVPATERYYEGGAASQRGFSDRRLSPEAHTVAYDPATMTAGTDPTSTVVIGGAGMVETGIEIRRHWEPFDIKAGWVVFLDGGDVTKTPSELDLGNLHWAVGAGLRLFYLPIGPIRIELARRLNRTNGIDDPSRGEHWNFILSVGEAF